MARSQTHRAATDERLVREATRWFVRVHGEEATAEDFNAWQQWLGQSPAHQQAFQSIEDFWQTAGQVTNPPWPSVNDLSNDRAPATLNLPLSTVLGERARAKGRVRGLFFNRYALVSLAAAIVLACAFLLNLSRDTSTLPDSATVKTATNELRDYTLTDGSQLAVSAQSRVTINFTANARRIIIDSGEAFFNVARDSRRPFVVQAGSGTVTALGTSFNVRNIPGRVVVTVVEGKVEVTDIQADHADAREAPDGQTNAVSPQVKRQTTRVAAGEEITYGNATASVRTVDASLATAWRTGHMKYLHEPMRFVIADVARYTDRQIVIADPEVGEMLYTGTVLPDDLDDWLTSVADALPIEMRRLDANTILLRERAMPVPSDAAVSQQ